MPYIAKNIVYLNEVNHFGVTYCIKYASYNKNNNEKQ